MDRFRAYTAAPFRAILCFIDPNNTPKIAADDDSLVDAVIEKVKLIVGDYDGTQSITWHYSTSDPVDMQIVKIIDNMRQVFSNILFHFEDRK